MTNNIKSTVVIDLGSGETKAGLAENEYPSCTIPTAISCDDSASKGFHVGNSAFANEHFSYPIEHGIVQNFEHIETLLQHVFSKELGVR